jgi:hypothetical protein
MAFGLALGMVGACIAAQMMASPLVVARTMVISLIITLFVTILLQAQAVPLKTMEKAIALISTRLSFYHGSQK